MAMLQCRIESNASSSKQSKKPKLFSAVQEAPEFMANRKAVSKHAKSKAAKIKNSVSKRKSNADPLLVDNQSASSVERNEYAALANPHSSQEPAGIRAKTNLLKSGLFAKVGTQGSGAKLCHIQEEPG